ncbi:unnamed protein product [Closterium sp. NIES-54]
MQLFLQCDSKDGLLLFDLTSGASTAPAADADSTVRSQWTTRDAAARLAVRIARYSSPAIAALSRLMLPYLFPDLAAFATVTDLITHLRASDTRYRAALPAEGAPLFLSYPPLPLLLLSTLLAPSRSALHLLQARGAATARASEERALEEVAREEVVAVEAEDGVGVGVVAEVGASVAAVEVEAAVAMAGGVEAAEAATAAVELVEAELCSGDPSSSSALVRPRRPSSFVSGTQGARGLGVLVPFPDATEIPRWGDLLRSGVAIFDLDFDAILAAMYAVSINAEGDCYVRLPPDPGIKAAAPGAGESALSGIASAQVLHTFTLDSGASCSFFRDRTTLTPLGRPVAVSLEDPSGGLVLAHYSTVLPCPAAPSGSLSGLYLPSFSTNLVSGADLQDGGVDQFTPASQRVTHCTCAQTGRHLATFTRRPGSRLYTLTTESLPVAASGQVAASSMASRVLVSGLPRSLPPLPLGLVPTCVPCVEGRQRAAPRSSEFPPTEAPLQTLHMDVWGPARVRGQGHERYFLLVVDDYSRYTTVFPLRHKDEVTERWRVFLRPFASLLSCGGHFQTFTLPASPQQNEIAERRIGMVMDVARTSMIHAAAPHFLWPFAVQYAAHQINLQPRVSMPETSPTLKWMGKVGEVSAFLVWGSRAFVRYLFVDKLSSRAVPCVFLGFPPDAPGWQFYHPTSRRVLSSQDITFDESVPYYHLFPYRAAPLPPPPLFLTPSPPPVDPLPPQGPAPSGVSQVDAVEPVEVAVESGTSGGAEPERAEPGGVEPGGAEPECAEPGGAGSGGAEPERAEPGGAEPGGAESGGAEPAGAGPGGPSGALSRRELPSAQELREWFARRWSLAARAGGAVGAGVYTAAGGVGATCPGGARTAGTGAAGPGGATGAGAPGRAGAGHAYGVGATGGAAGAGAPVGAGVGAGGGAAAGAVGVGADAAGAGAVPAGSGGATRQRPYFVPLLEKVLGPAPSLECPLPVQSESQLQLASPLPAPSSNAGPTGGLPERREPDSRPASPVRAARTSRRALRQRPFAVPGTHQMTLRPSTAPQRVPLPSPPESSLPALADLEFDSFCATNPTVTRFLAAFVTDPSFESTAASALVAELVDFAAHCRVDYAAILVAKSESVCPTSVGGECALSTDVLEDRQEEFQCFAAALPHLVSMLLAPEGDPDAPDIPTPRSYAEAIEGPYSSQWQVGMDAEMAS